MTETKDITTIGRSELFTLLSKCFDNEEKHEGWRVVSLTSYISFLSPDVTTTFTLTRGESVMHKHSALITQFAKMIAAGHPIDMLVQYRVVPAPMEWIEYPEPVWYENDGEEYRVAIAFIEGKPVFEGDKLWCMKYQEPVTAISAVGDDIIVQPPQEIRVNIQMPHERSRITKTSDLSWTSPKPSIADLKINIDASAINEATRAMQNLTIATDEARMAMDRLRK